MLIASLVGAIVLWSTLPKYMDGLFWIGFGTLAGGAAVAVFTGIMLQGFGIIVASSEANLNGTASVSNKIAFQKAPENNVQKKTADTDEQSWKCPKCGKRNTNKYCTICSTRNPALATPVAKKPETAREAGENEWKCPTCGKINQNYVGTCGCGKLKP